ncbi:Uncharacterised protein [Vibrio cholerae]|nr:Uncharacterised protein [Vibrio cholerae]
MRWCSFCDFVFHFFFRDWFPEANDECSGE